MSHKRVHHLYFLDTNQTHLKEAASMAAHDPYLAAKIVLFFYNEVYTLTIMHTLTSGNTIATRALRCFSHHNLFSNKLTEEHFLRAHSAGLSLQEIRPVDITAAHRGSACSPIRGEQSICVYERGRGRERAYMEVQRGRAILMHLTIYSLGGVQRIIYLRTWI